MFRAIRSLPVIMTVFILAFATIARADDSAMHGIGGNVQPLKSHPTIRMVSEEVRIDNPEDPRVTASFVFRNEGPATDALMGFPEMSGGDTAGAKAASLIDFRSWIDGIPTSIALRRAQESNHDESYKD